MKLFITGATGFVGYHIAKVFVQRGGAVTALARQSSDVSRLEQLGVDVRRAGLLDPESYRQALVGCDVVVHCAGLIKALNLEGFLRVNRDGAGAVAAAAASVGIRRFVLISSIAARGQWDPRGTGKWMPVSKYGVSKLAGEQAVRANEGNMEVSIIRPPPVYGPCDTGMLDVFRMASRGLFPVYGRGRGQISIVHGRDVARAVWKLSVHPGRMPPGPFYTEDGANPTYQELRQAFEAAFCRRLRRIFLPPFLVWTAGAGASLVSRLRHKPSLFGLDKVREMSFPVWVCSSAELTEATGWTPSFPLAAGLEETLRWYRQHGWLKS